MPASRRNDLIFGMPSHLQDEVLTFSLSDPDTFWKKQAEHLHWHKRPLKPLVKSSKTLKSGASHDYWEWFSGGEISTCYNCVDRHVDAGNGDSIAIIWDSPVTGSKEKYTYKQLQGEVEVFAGVLREEGVKRGDVVLIYSSSLPNNLHILPLTHSSAHDPCSIDCHSSHLSTRSHTCCRLRWICSCIFGPAHRSIKAYRNPHRLLWY